MFYFHFLHIFFSIEKKTTINQQISKKKTLKLKNSSSQANIFAIISQSPKHVFFDPSFPACTPSWTAINAPFAKYNSHWIQHLYSKAMQHMGGPRWVSQRHMSSMCVIWNTTDTIQIIVRNRFSSAQLATLARFRRKNIHITISLVSHQTRRMESHVKSALR